MPIYEYACSGCGIKFEMHRSISDDTLPGCPSCKATSVKKLISQTAFQLKGSGWYKDGYGSTAPKAVADVSKETKSPDTAATPKVEKTASDSTATPVAKDSNSKKEAAGT